jgi:hypothetical protein
MSHAQRAVIDPMADTMQFDILGDTLRIDRAELVAAFNSADSRWFREGDRRAELEWADVDAHRRSRGSARIELAVALASSAIAGFVLASFL